MKRLKQNTHYIFPSSLYKKLPLNMWRVIQLEIGFKMIQTGKSYSRSFCEVRIPIKKKKSLLLSVVDMYLLTRKLFFDLKKNYAV